MKFFVGITDSKWFNFLADRMADEANFWRPRSTQQFHAIQVGEPFLFKLHSPADFIVGGGFLVKHEVLPISLAWKAFGEKNGALTFEDFRQNIINLGGGTEFDHRIGCTILAETFFFKNEEWIPSPPDWKGSIMVGKTYDTAMEIGKNLWAEVETRLQRLANKPSLLSAEPKYGAEYLARGRIGQGAFRVLVTDAYTRRCAITAERTLPVLEAGHIKPFSEGGGHLITNGLLLRSDLHTLFDRGYITVTPDLRVEISSRIREEFDNGKEYYKLHGNLLLVQPKDKINLPAREFLQWHNEQKFAS